MSAAPDAPRAVVWLDRDGTVVDDPGYLREPERLRLLPGAAAAIASLRRCGAAVVLVTNQSGIGRGLMARAEVDAVHAELLGQLARSGTTLDGLYLCPHAPADDGASPACPCRKPAPGLVLRARHEMGLDDLPQVVVGDRATDLGLADAVGVPAVLVLTGEGRRTLDDPTARAHPPAHVAQSLADAVPWILQRLGLVGLAPEGPSC